MKNYVILYLDTCNKPESQWLFVGAASVGTKAPFLLAQRFSLEMGETVMNQLISHVAPLKIALTHVKTFENEKRDK